jgi:chemotaxis protein CheD
MESLINEILKLGGLRHRLEVKLFGGGKIYEGNIDIGANNAAWALEYLKNEGLEAQKTDLGDVYPRKLYYFIDSGRVLMKKIQRVKDDTIFDREVQYQKQLAREQEASNVTLF